VEQIVVLFVVFVLVPPALVAGMSAATRMVWGGKASQAVPRNAASVRILRLTRQCESHIFLCAGRHAKCGGPSFPPKNTMKKHDKLALRYIFEFSVALAIGSFLVAFVFTWGWQLFGFYFFVIYPILIVIFVILFSVLFYFRMFSRGSKGIRILKSFALAIVACVLLYPTSIFVAEWLYPTGYVGP